MATNKAMACSIIAVGMLLGFQSARAQADAAGGPTIEVAARDTRAALPDASAVTQPGIKPGAVVAQSSGAPAHQLRGHESAATFQIPKSMEIEHEELHADLARLTQAGGRTGEAAKAVAQVLDSHFANENDYALPPLGLLVPLSQGKFDCSMTEVLNMTDKLEAEMPTMLSEHKDITAALGKLSEAAKAENKVEGVQFAEMLAAHAQAEEEITYPTALLIGLYVKSKDASCPR